MRREQIMLPVLRAVVARPWLTAVAFGRDRWGNPFADEVVNNPYEYVARMWEDGPIMLAGRTPSRSCRHSIGRIRST